jgi:hypothetical protein
MSTYSYSTTVCSTSRSASSQERRNPTQTLRETLRGPKTGGPKRPRIRMDKGFGGVPEWSNGAVLKTVEGQPSGGSNPSPAVA